MKFIIITFLNYTFLNLIKKFEFYVILLFIKKKKRSTMKVILKQNEEQIKSTMSEKSEKSKQDKIIEDLIIKNNELYEQIQLDKLKTENMLTNEKLIRHLQFEENKKNVDKLNKDILYWKGHALYQKNKKIQARKNNNINMKSLKKSINTQLILETKINTIRERIKDLSKKNPNYQKDFNDLFPEIKDKITCPLCCEDHNNNETYKCPNEKCNIQLCKCCVSKINTKCPYCQCQWENENNENDENYESDYDYEFEYIFDSIREPIEMIPPLIHLTDTTEENQEINPVEPYDPYYEQYMTNNLMRRLTNNLLEQMS